MTRFKLFSIDAVDQFLFALFHAEKKYRDRKRKRSEEVDERPSKKRAFLMAENSGEVHELGTSPSFGGLFIEPTDLGPRIRNANSEYVSRLSLSRY